MDKGRILMDSNPQFLCLRVENLYFRWSYNVAFLSQ